MSYKNYKRITKAQARKLFDAGKTIYLHTNKLSWNNPWQNPMDMTKDFERERSEKELHQWNMDNGYTTFNVGATVYERRYIEQFDERVNNYKFYNCDDERGNVVIYLIEN